MRDLPATYKRFGLAFAAGYIVFFSNALMHSAETQTVITRPSIARAAEGSDDSQRQHVAVLTTGESGAPGDPTIIELRRGLREAGYIEGDNLVLTVSPSKTYEQLRADISRYLRKKVNVFITIGATPTDIARSMIQTTPVVFMPTRNPVGRGLVKSLRRSGTNFTGLSYEGNVNIEGKQVEIFKEVVPRLQHLWVLYEGTYTRPVSAGSIDPLREISTRLGLTFTKVAVRSYPEIERAIVNLPRDNALGVYAICTQFFVDDKTTPSVARDSGVPFYGCPTQVRKFGALLSYAPDFAFIGRRGAWYVDKLLKGAKPQDMPVETPRKFELMINLKTANKIGVKIPPHVLQWATTVIE